MLNGQGIVIVGHDGEAILAQISGFVGEDHRIGIENRFGEVVSGVMGSHAGQVGPGFPLFWPHLWEFFSGNSVAGVALHPDIDFSSRICIPLWDVELPPLGNAARLVQVLHCDSNGGDGCFLLGHGRLLMLVATGGVGNLWLIAPDEQGQCHQSQASWNSGHSFSSSGQFNHSCWCAATTGHPRVSYTSASGSVVCVVSLGESLFSIGRVKGKDYFRKRNRKRNNPSAGNSIGDSLPAM